MTTQPEEKRVLIGADPRRAGVVMEAQGAANLVPVLGVVKMETA